MDEKIINVALSNLRKSYAIEADYIATPEMPWKWEMNISIMGETENFRVLVRRELRNHQLPWLKDYARRTGKTLVVAENIFPPIKEELRNAGIGYLDVAGNIFVLTPKFSIWHDGNKIYKGGNEKPDRLFKNAGLRLIFRFLVDDKILNQSQRLIAEKSGIALGNVSTLLSALKSNRFLIENDKKQHLLIDREKLLEKWLDGFEERLKPSLHLGNFKFTIDDNEMKWKELKFNKNETLWGGEPAGAVITKYLQPQIFTLYTRESVNALIKNYRLVPDPKGNIHVYKIFWKDQITYDNDVVHPIIAYADLISSGENRCIETARIIYEKSIKQYL